VQEGLTTAWRGADQRNPPPSQLPAAAAEGWCCLSSRPFRDVREASLFRRCSNRSTSIAAAAAVQRTRARAAALHFASPPLVVCAYCQAWFCSVKVHVVHHSLPCVFSIKSLASIGRRGLAGDGKHESAKTESLKYYH
jgi:hypothetical protein